MNMFVTALIFIYCGLSQTDAIPCPVSCYGCDNSYHGNNQYRDSDSKVINCVVYPDQKRPVTNDKVANKAYLSLHRYALVSQRRSVIEKKKRRLLGLIDSNVNSTLPNLAILHLHHNQITELSSKSFPRCPSLTELDFTDNRIETVEEGLFSSYRFPKLRYLKLGHNEIKSVGIKIGLPSLIELHVSKNRILNITKTMVHFAMPNLTKIVADHNLIETVEKGSFDYLKNLKFINLHKNPLTNFTVFTDSFDRNIKLDENFLDLRCECTKNFNNQANKQVVCNNPRGCAFCKRGKSKEFYYASFSSFVDLGTYCVSLIKTLKKPKIEYVNHTNLLPQNCTSNNGEQNKEHSNKVLFELDKSVSCNASPSTVLCHIFEYTNLWSETESVTIRNLNNKNESSNIESCSKNDFDLINIHEYSKVFPSLKLLDIQHSIAKRLHYTHNSSLAQSLQTLLLNNNRIGPRISTYNFPDCKNLKRFEIANNSIDSIDYYLFRRNFPNLEYLVLDGNNIKFVDFSLSLPKLIKVSFQNNKIKGLDKRVFRSTPSLKHIDLRRGNLLNNFTITKDLRDVDLHFVAHNYHVNSLDFHCECYSGKTPKMGNWGWSNRSDAEQKKCLNPSGCSVCKYAGSDKQDAYFKQVSINGDLSEFDNLCAPDVSRFGRFGVEPTVDLRGMTVDQNVVGSVRLLDLSSVGCGPDFVISNMTVGIKNTETLVMKNNSIGPDLRKFQFPQLLNLNIANFNNNSISSIERDLFTEKFPNVEIISFAHNRISSFHFNLKNLQLLRALHFPGNLLGPRLSCSGFGPLAGVDFLDFSLNEIETIDENYFTECFPILRKVLLDKNKIVAFNFDFSRLPVKTISIKENQLITIQEEKLKHTPNLKHLNLENNVNLEGITITEDLREVRIAFSQNLTSSSMNFQCRCTEGNFKSWYVNSEKLKREQRCFNPFGCSSCEITEEIVSTSGSRKQSIAFSQVRFGNVLAGNVLKPCAAEENYFGRLENIAVVNMHKILADNLMDIAEILPLSSKKIHTLAASNQKRTMKSLIYLNMHNNSIGPIVRKSHFPLYNKLVSMILSKNNLSFIEHRFFETICPKIKGLWLSENNLHSLINVHFKNLLILDLNDNRFGNHLGNNSLPDIESLETLHIAGNRIGSIGYSFFTERFPNLTELRLDRNDIRFMDFNLDIGRLKRLYLQGNRLGPYLTHSAKMSKNITHLDLSKNGIEFIRNAFFSTKLPNLEYLWLNGNKIEMFDLRLELPKLSFFSIANNSMTGVRSDAFYSTKLVRSLNLHEGNQIEVYHVDLSNSNLTDLVSEAYRVANSVSLDASSNLLGNYLNVSKSPVCVHARSLNLQNNGIERVEKNFFSLNFPKLESLNLARNKLVVVDFDLNLPLLSYISFYRNRVRNIEEWTYRDAPSLNRMTMRHNHMLSGFKLTRNLQGAEIAFDAVGMGFNCQCKPGRGEELVDFSGWGWESGDEQKCLNEDGCSQCTMTYDDASMYYYVDFHQTPFNERVRYGKVCPPDTTLFGNFTVEPVT